MSFLPKLPHANDADVDAALDEAEHRHRPWHRALITERAGLFQLTQGLGHAARKLLADARDQYQARGARAKVVRMELEHAFLSRATAPGTGAHLTHTAVRESQPEQGGSSTPPASPDSVESVNLLDVLRASQALSAETGLEQLAARVTEVLAALSGATQVRVLRCKDDQWWLIGPQPGEPAIPLAEAGRRGLLSLSAVAHAESAGQRLLADDALDDQRLAGDPCFAGLSRCSLLLVPIASEGMTRAMLYLENRERRAAFSAERLEAVMLIARQLAVALANVERFQNLEQRVRSRTRELEQAEAQLRAAARSAGQAEAANNVLHNVGNVLNSINVSASVARSTIENSRIEGLARAVALMNEHKDEFGRFIQEDRRGEVLLAYLNHLVEALETERHEALGNLERLARSVEHVTHVVSTQQSQAAPSSVMELTSPHELLDEALRLTGEAIEATSVQVVRRYGPAPSATLDKQRLLQILVNLIGNALQAMEHVPAASRLLTLQCELMQRERGPCLRFTVRDQGQGIAQENLARIFAHGFTTRKGGHGFGLHSSALAAMEMGGKLTAHSQGPGHGAEFILDVPINAGEAEPAGSPAGLPPA